MLRIFINWLLQNPVVKFVNSCTSQRLYTAGCCRIDSRLFGSLLLIAALNVFGFTVPSVHAQTPAACIYADSQKLTDSVQVLDARYESALAELKNFGAFTCPEFTQPPPGWESKHKTVLGLNALSTEASNRFAETRCVDFLLLSLFSYRAYFRRSCRQLAPPRRSWKSTSGSMPPLKRRGVWSVRLSSIRPTAPPSSWTRSPRTSRLSMTG